MTECEIFLSLIVKFLDPDKPTWQRALALEVLHKMTVQADLLTNFCECYDLKPHATNIFQDIVNSLGAYVHSLFVNPQMMNQTGMSAFILQQLHVLNVLIVKHNFCIFITKKNVHSLSAYKDILYIFTNSNEHNRASRHRLAIVHSNAYRAWRIASIWFLFAWYLVTSSSNIYKRTS